MLNEWIFKSRLLKYVKNDRKVKNQAETKVISRTNCYSVYGSSISIHFRFITVIAREINTRNRHEFDFILFNVNWISWLHNYLIGRSDINSIPRFLVSNFTYHIYIFNDNKFTRYTINLSISLSHIDRFERRIEMYRYLLIT